MSNYIDPIIDGATPMSAYEQRVWDTLNKHWHSRSNRRGLPNWANAALEKGAQVAEDAGQRVADAMPERIKLLGDAAIRNAARPALKGAIGMLRLVNDWALDLNDPRSVEKLAHKRGLNISTFAELGQEELKTCDRLLTSNTLKWRTAGAVEGAAMGVLALVPVAGIPVAITADILVVQVLSLSIASRIAYSYGFDAKDPAEQEFIQRLVNRSFIAQAAKAGTIRDAAIAARVVRQRVRWSEKLRLDHRLLAAIEALLKQLAPKGAHISVQAVSKVVPFVSILIGAGTNSTILGNVARDAQRYCQTRFLCEKYGLPLPDALLADPEDEFDPDIASGHAS